MDAPTDTRSSVVLADPARIDVGHVRGLGGEAAIQSIFAKIKMPEDKLWGCWEWQGNLNATGYGTWWCNAQRKSLRAHRVLYELYKGRIADEVDHLCMNKGCVNPEHLEDVPHRTNILRGESPPAVNYRKTHCARGHKLPTPGISGRICTICSNKQYMSYVLRHTLYALCESCGRNYPALELDGCPYCGLDVR